MQAIIDYFVELDHLKLVSRKTYLNDQSRQENSAEHSWHLAMACWNLAEYFKLDVDHGKLLKLALVHDLGEIDAGDTFLYSNNREDADIKEREGVLRLAQHKGNYVTDLIKLWDEQEYGDSAEVKLLKAADRLLPLMMNIHTKGRAWRELGVKKSQVLAKHGFIKQTFPEIFNWIEIQVAEAVKQGWLINE
ncbi:HD domain-containing protein [Catenovulum sp. 2E275]|uniref:HD domain-containing protein n=1 Tax=Catenovulum sp. 2E275 TaxID=2980497 RepID=UPI0021D0DF6F|nr:HD domain-containing protein [Catenovulum sp. 2E275]MCU4675711.1 HD domain-containing protein [Catenovulum sp. 2E275]